MNKRFKIFTPGFTTIAACVLGTLSAQQASASGFRVPEISILGLGTSNALVANTEELGALAYNPAGMSFHDGKGIAAGVVHIGYDHSVTIGGTTTDGNGEDSFLVPNLFVMARDTNANWSFGLAVNAPFGLETSYPNETFSAFSGATDPLEPAISRIKMININPNIAYKIDNTSSISIGLLYYDVQELVFNTQSIEINGRGDGYGFNLGYQKKFANLNFGVMYRSAVDTDLKGTFNGLAVGSTILAANAGLEFPAMLQAGVLFQATDSISLEFDAEYTGWDSFSEIKVNNSAGTNLTTSTNNWDNAWAYRFGVIYKLNNQTKLLFGYSYDETPQPDTFFSARVPDNDRQLFSIGVTHDFGNWSLEAGYMYVKVDDRTVSSATNYTSGDPNGTNAYNGTYESEVNLLGVGLTMTF